MAHGIFITGTDTGVGKTRFTILLMETLKAQGYKIAGMKPVASGAEKVKGKLFNEDAIFIQKHCSEKTDYDLINPTVFEPPIAPHIAAAISGTTINLDGIRAAYDALTTINDVVIVEGVGGWRVPLSEELFLRDLVITLNLPVLMVVGLRLGCINHAILTAETVISDGLKFCGWATSKIDNEYENTKETLQTLKSSLKAPLIAEVPFLKGGSSENTPVEMDLSLISQYLPANM